MRPTAHSLSFASPKESKQRKGDPGSSAPGYRGCLALLAGGGKRRTRPSGSNNCASFPASRCAAQLVSRAPKSQYTTARCASQRWCAEERGLAKPNEPFAGVCSWGPRWRRRAAQGKTDQEVQMSEPAGRVSELPVLHEQRRAAPKGPPESGSPFLCLLSFGEAKESECAVGRISRRGATQQDPIKHRNRHRGQPS